MSVKASSTDALEDAIEGDAEVQESRPSNGDGQTQRSASMQAVARGSTRRGDMNQTEQRWAARLELSEQVEAWRYEEYGFRYGANDSTHWPDFWVMREDGRIEIHEVKGYVKDAGRLRFLACADRHPHYRWMMVVQRSPSSEWTCKYDTQGRDGAPILQHERA